MKKITVLFLTVLLTGCGNLSPRINPQLKEEIDNQNGKIGQIENNQNSIKNDLFNLRSQSEIHDSQLREVQQGYFNLQRLISEENTNFGIQIFSGTGGLLLYFITICVVVIMIIAIFYYKSMADKHSKISNLLTEKILKSQNVHLQKDILETATYTDIAQELYKLFNNKIKSLNVKTLNDRS